MEARVVGIVEKAKSGIVWSAFEVVTGKAKITFEHQFSHTTFLLAWFFDGDIVIDVYSHGDVPKLWFPPTAACTSCSKGEVVVVGDLSLANLCC